MKKDVNVAPAENFTKDLRPTMYIIPTALAPIRPIRTHFINDNIHPEVQEIILRDHPSPMVGVVETIGDHGIRLVTNTIGEIGDGITRVIISKTLK